MSLCSVIAPLACGATVEHVTEMAGREVAHAGVVDDVDASYERAVRAGGRSVEPPADKPYGERGAWVIDPFENQWFIATAK
jgi:uncharacterized glyoxalase superfamily protein PhnB